MSINLAQIATGARIKPPLVVLYGIGGVGKTTLVAGDPTQGIVGASKPIFLFTEEGQGRLDVPRFELRPNEPVLRTFDEVMGCLRALAEQDHGYETVCLDTLDGFETLLWAHTARKHGKADIEAFGYGKGYIAAVDEAREMMRAFEYLRNKKNMAVVLIAHHQIKKFESPDMPSYDRYLMRLQERFNNAIYDWTDAVLFVNWKASIVRDKEGRDQERTRAVGQGTRMMYTQERPTFQAKNRYGLPPELPIGWTHFVDAIVPPDASPPTDSPAPTSAS